MRHRLLTRVGARPHPDVIGSNRETDERVGSALWPLHFSTCHKMHEGAKWWRQLLRTVNSSNRPATPASAAHPKVRPPALDAVSRADAHRVLQPPPAVLARGVVQQHQEAAPRHALQRQQAGSKAGLCRLLCGCQNSCAAVGRQALAVLPVTHVLDRQCSHAGRAAPARLLTWRW